MKEQHSKSDHNGNEQNNRINLGAVFPLNIFNIGSL